MYTTFYNDQMFYQSQTYKNYKIKKSFSFLTGRVWPTSGKKSNMVIEVR